MLIWGAHTPADGDTLHPFGAGVGIWGEMPLKSVLLAIAADIPSFIQASSQPKWSG